MTTRTRPKPQIQCPIKECATYLQRTEQGTVMDGVAAHLKTVHSLTADTAGVLAERAVREHEETWK